MTQIYVTCLRLYFENEGYEVKTANDGADGISCFQNV